VVDPVPGHQLLRLGRERIGLLREVGGLRLGQQCPDPVQHPLVEVRRRGRRDRPGIAGRRTDNLDRRQRGEQMKYVDQRGDHGGAVQTLAVTPDRRVMVVVFPPHPRVEDRQL
jgi:hypothetical protein